MKKTSLVTLLLWMALLAVSAYQVLVNTVIGSDMTVFMPKTADPRFGLLTKGASDSPAARLWLLAIEGDNSDELARSSKLLSESLRNSGRFNIVLNGENLLADEDEEFLFRHRYLLDPNNSSDAFSVESLKKQLTERLAELSSPLSSFTKKWLAADPTAVFRRVAQNMSGQSNSPDYYNGVWMTKGQDRALIIAETNVAGMDLDGQTEVKAFIETSLSNIKDSSNIRLRFSGSPNIAIQSRDQIKSESQRLSMLATFFMLAFLLWIYRSPKRVMMTIVPLATAVLVATAAVSFIFGGIHGITLAFGVTVLGVAVDYPIHVISHANNNERLSETVKRIWPTLRLGVISTILGYSAMAITEFPGLSQFGVFSIVGLLTAAYVTRHLFSEVNFSAAPTPRLFQASTKLNVKPGKIIYTIVALSFIGAITTLMSIDEYWSKDLSKLSPIPANVIAQDRELRQLLDVDQPRYIITVTAKDLETLLQREEKLMPELQRAINANEIQGAHMATQILPSQLQQTSRKSQLPDEQTLSDNMNTALRDFPFRPKTFEPFMKDIALAKNMKNVSYQQLQDSNFRSQLAGLITQDDNGFTGLVRLTGIQHADKLQQRLASAQLPGVTFTDIKQSSSDMISLFRQESLDRIFWAAGLLIFVLGIGLRNLNRFVRVITPVICAVLISSAVPLGLGEKLTIFHVVSMLLVAGISLDYGLFFSWSSKTEDNNQTLHALSICAISTVTVFSLLATASIPVLHSIGLTVAVGVFSAFILSWTFSRSFNTQVKHHEI